MPFCPLKMFHTFISTFVVSVEYEKMDMVDIHIPIYVCMVRIELKLSLECIYMIMNMVRMILKPNGWIKLKQTHQWWFVSFCFGLVQSNPIQSYSCVLVLVLVFRVYSFVISMQNSNFVLVSFDFSVELSWEASSNGSSQQSLLLS